MVDKSKNISFFEQDYRYFVKMGYTWEDTARILKTAADKLLTPYSIAIKYLLDEANSVFNLKEGNEPNRVSATDMDYASREPDKHLYPVYMLLMGYAIENLFKGIIICEMWLENPKSVDKNFIDIKPKPRGGDQDMRFDKHGLDYLLGAEKMTDFKKKFNHEEKNVMEEIDWYVEWGGRYPVNKKNKGEMPFPFGHVDPYEESYNIAITKIIYDKAAAELNRLDELQQKRLKGMSK